MIIFDLDGTLADNRHRHHLVDSSHPKNLEITDGCTICVYENGNCESNHQIKKFVPDWKAFYEACDQDKPIQPVINIFKKLWDIYEVPIQIWSGRCESVREKTQNWLSSLGLPLGSFLKMRPIGDNTPDHELKKRWLDERCKHVSLNLDSGLTTRSEHDIELVFDSDPKSIAMWRRRGVFVFDCCQGEKF